MIIDGANENPMQQENIPEIITVLILSYTFKSVNNDWLPNR